MKSLAYAYGYHISTEYDKINRNKYVKKTCEEETLFAKDSCAIFFWMKWFFNYGKNLNV